MQQDPVYKLTKPLSIVIILFLLTAFLDRIVQEGMFFDGVTYAAISRNLAIGKGDLWNLYYRGDVTIATHPPVMFSIEALFFKLFGDHYLTERIYCLVIWLLTIIGITRLWKYAGDGAAYKSSSLLPVLCWGIIPVVMWGYPNNLLDSTMGLIDLLAVMLIYQACSKNKNSNLLLFVAGIAVFLASFTKGPLGFFPLAVPFIYWLIFHKQSFSKMLLYSIIPIVTLVVIYTALYSYPPARNFMEQYIQQQLLTAIRGEQDAVTSPLGRLLLLQELVSQLLPSLVILIVLFVLAKIFRHKAELADDNLKKHAYFYLLVGLAASLPIMVSLKQRPFYIIPALPYFALGIAMLAYPYFDKIVNKTIIPAGSIKAVKATLLLASVGALIYVGSKIGKIGREEELITDIKTMQHYIPAGEKIGICRAMDADYTFLAYMQRYHRLEVNLKYHHARYVLVHKEACGSNFTACLNRLGYRDVPCKLKKYWLMKRDYSVKSPLPESR